ncbi:MAG: tRNA (adenosine(37)-N6)-threonylcarbamoyltransferase complex ATPase subunit type 1 TsaE [Oscillospiraceae bacterium]
MEKYISNSKQDTVALARSLGQRLKNHDIIFFEGGLGMGKTAFCQGLCDGLGIKATATSPTFAIVNEYIGSPLSLYHFDMYRIESEEQLYNIGFYDYLNYDGIIAVEWSENIKDFFSQSTVTVSFEKTGEDTRIIKIDGAELL